MESTIKELWHGNIIPQEDSRTNSKEMKELLDTHIDFLCKFIRQKTCIKSIKLMIIRVDCISALFS